jgi:hypothetical protein
MRYCSIQKNAVQPIPHNVWTNIHTYTTVNKDTHSTGDTFWGVIYSTLDAVYLYSSYIKWQSNSVGGRYVRFIREDGDYTGVMEWDATSGRDFLCHNWPSYMRDGRWMAMQVMQTSGSDLNVELAQFKSTKISD